jgi:hypothetical protein
MAGIDYIEVSAYGSADGNDYDEEMPSYQLLKDMAIDCIEVI